MKILPVGAEFFLAEGRTDMTKLIVLLRNFVNAPKNSPKNWEKGKWNGVFCKYNAQYFS